MTIIEFFNLQLDSRRFTENHTVKCPQISLDRFNTIAGWTLAAFGTALALSIAGGMVFHGEKPAKEGYPVEAAAETGGGGGAAADVPIASLLPKADATKGADVFKKCAACHTINQGGANGVGPNLYGVVGDAIAQGRAGFDFSGALKAVGGKWDFDKLNAWLTSPRKFADGTKMTFAGLSKPEDRANVIDYLDKQSDAPVPLPPPPAAGPAPASATAAGTNADTKPGANTSGEGAKTQPVVSEGQAAATPQGLKATVGGEGAPAITGNSAQQRK